MIEDKNDWLLDSSGFTESSWKSSQINNNFGSSSRVGQEMIILPPLEPQEDDAGWSSGEFSNSEEEVWSHDAVAPHEQGSEHGYCEVMDTDVKKRYRSFERNSYSSKE